MFWSMGRCAAVVAGVLVAATLGVPAQAVALATETIVRGTLVRVDSQEVPGDGEHEHGDHDQVFVRTSGGMIAVPAESVEDVSPGSTVAVTLTSGSATAHSLDAGTTSAATAVASGQASVVGVQTVTVYEPSGQAGTHHVTVMPVYWQTADVPAGQPSSADIATDLSAAMTDLDTYYNATTGGDLRVVTDRVLPWTKLSVPASTCDNEALLAISAAQNVARLSGGFQHLVLYFPRRNDCAWAGLGSVGTWGGYGAIWLNGYSDLRVTAHEFGHNLGLGHSGGLTCTDGTPKVPLSSTCTTSEYDDPWEVMGGSSSGHVGFMSAAHLNQAGLLPSSASQYVGRDTQVTVQPVESGAGLRNVVIPAGAYTYYLEYRTPSSLDDWIDDRTAVAADASNGEALPGAGVIVRRAASGGAVGAKQFVLDFHPTWSADVRGLRSGESWLSADGSLGFAVTAADSSSATVNITRAADTVDPTVTLTAPADAAALGPDTYASWTAADTDSGLVRLDVELDGAVVKSVTSAGAIPSYATLSGLSGGAHTLAVRVWDAAGNETVVGPRDFTVDAVLPTVDSAPRAILRTGPVTAAEVKVTLGWGVSDAGGVCTQFLSRDPLLIVGAARTSRTVATTAAVGAANTWTLHAYDCYGNLADGPGISTTVGLNPQSVRTGYSGTWTAASSSSYLGRTEQLTKRAGSKAVFRVTARSIGWVATKAANRGKVAVYVDNRKVAVVDLYARTTTVRQQVWVTSFASAGPHTVVLVNLATAGRPYLGIDAFTSLS